MSSSKPWYAQRCVGVVVCALALVAGNRAHAAPLSGTSATYRGTCDASAAVALDARHFVVGNDETDTLLVYREGQPGAVAQAPLRSFLGGTGRAESDIEGAAAIGSRIYWIASHSRNSRGEAQPMRQRLFATDVVAGHVPTVAPVGTTYQDLLRDLVSAPALASWNLATASTLAAEAAGGLNIEGLAATPDGRLLVGFRNPLRDGRALVVPLDNPDEIVAGKRARLGSPMALDLGNRGIRSLDRVGDVYYVVAGPVADTGTFALFRWSGGADDAPVAVAVDLGTLRPEALFAWPDRGSLTLLSDDGGVKVDGRECKRLPHREQAFRTLTLHP